MGGESQGDFFGGGEHDENMMGMMSAEMDHMGDAFGEMSEDQMASFMEGMGEDSAMMNIGEMAGMGMDMGDMAEMSMDMGMDMGDMGMDMGMGIWAAWMDGRHGHGRHGHGRHGRHDGRSFWWRRWMKAV